jgi:hypothetical protein
MAGKKAPQAPQSAAKRSSWQWIRSHKFSTGTVLALIALYVGYLNTGADSLRADIYQPLYREINAMELPLEANNTQQQFSSHAFELLRQNGNLGRIPKSL